MADIDLERKSSGSLWPWIAGLAVLALLAWGVGEALDTDEAAVVASDDVEEVREPETREAETLDGAATRDGATLAAVLADPASHVGASLASGEYTVGEVPTDRGFWIAGDDGQLLGIIVDEPREEPVDINPGDELRIDGGTLHDPSFLPDVPGVPLDADTRALAEDQEAFLVVNEEHVTKTDASDRGAMP